MVEFEKLLGKEKLTRTIDPIGIFNDLDKESGKEYFRPAQEAILNSWHQKSRNQKDTIVKLHTGQGKTLIGLLMLQSSINEGKGPAIYLCPNKYLVTQTIEQAHSFGIETTQFAEDSTRPPRDFLNSEAILVTNCNKLFNGKSVFGVAGSGKEPVHIGTIVMDDAHKCLEIIRESFSIIVDRDNADGSKNHLYEELWALFEESLKRQAPGTCLDIYHGEDGIMAVPFWTWYERRKDTLDVLSKYKDTEKLLFVWDLLKDKIDQCICIFSGRSLEIAPRLLPLELIPSFAQSQRRIFLSATLTEDAFLVRNIGIEPESVLNPLSSREIKYSGERLILIPTLVDTSLRREKIVGWLSKLAERYGSFGIVAIVPSFRHATDWQKAGANVTSVKNLYQNIDELKARVKRKDAKTILVLVNEYDGIDLPDSTCRILCLDSLPSYSSLIDRYAQEMRPNSRVLRRQLAQRIEQGIGRAIRGSSDWCIAVITGNDLTDFLSEDAKRIYLSNEAQMQIKIGEELASEMRIEGTQLSVIEKLISQCLNRDAGWKEYYKTKMAKVETREQNKDYLDRSVLERKAEILYQQGHFQKAVEVLQNLISSSDQTDKGWFFQQIAIYQYPVDPSKSMELQLKAHTENYKLFHPETGISYSKLSSSSTPRATKILEMIKRHQNYNSLCVHVLDILDKVSFNVLSDLFEDGIDELGNILGFMTQRPEKAYGCGPDNLWLVGSKTYWIIECKNMVSADRNKISKSEAGQLNNSIGWFKENYENCSGVPILIHPAKTQSKDAFVTEPFWVLQPDTLDTLKVNIRNFYNSLKEISFDNLDNLSQNMINQKLKEFHLEITDLKSQHLVRVEERNKME